MPITAFYASIIAFLFLALSFRTIKRRRLIKLELGTITHNGEDDRELLRRVRVHANCAEYAPIGIILLGLAESLKGAPLVLHALGAMLIIGRMVHAYGLSQSPHNLTLRVSGMVMTLTMIALAAATCVMLAAPAAFRF